MPGGARGSEGVREGGPRSAVWSTPSLTTYTVGYTDRRESETVHNRAAPPAKKKIKKNKKKYFS